MQKFLVFYFFADVFLFMDLLNPRFIFNPRFKSWAKEGLYFCVYLRNLRDFFFSRMSTEKLYFS